MNAPLALDTQGSMPLRDSRFTVPGMRCAGCISKIERGLAKLEGVDAARVNFSAKRVAVRHDRKFDAEELVAAIG
ncbi:MAG TPA: nitrogen fixation protein FixI, partial [Erythrobacter sp.]|nr:nitrogen fixation protein FixI [Erythrobacter sp.]